MVTPDAPPLPSAAPLTAAAATRWRAARTAWRLDSRWLALLPLGFLLLATAVEPGATECNPQGVCRDGWGSQLAVWSTLTEVVLLLARVRWRAAVPPLVLALLWYLPGGLVTTAGRWTAVLLHGLLAAVLIAAELGRRTARQQLDELMAPPVPFPWSAADAPSPVPADPGPALRRVLAWLLLAAALGLTGLGCSDWIRDRTSAERAATVVGTAGPTDQDGVLTVRYRPSGGDPERTAELDTVWVHPPRPGDQVRLRVDGDWVRAAGDEEPLPDLFLTAALVALPGLLLLGSAATATRQGRTSAFQGAAPALAVRVRADARGHLLVRPLDGPPDGPALWRLVERDRYRWARYGAPDGEGPAWVPEDLETDGDELDYPEPDGRAPDDRLRPPTPEAAVARFARAGRTVDAVLYRGPDGLDRQLLVRPGLLAHDPHWVAAVVAPAARAPRLARSGERYRERELAVAALTAETVAAAPEAGPDTEPVLARRWEMPIVLRAAVGPVTATALAFAVVLIGGTGWWQGLLRPLWIGCTAILACCHTLSWQMVADRNGLRVAGPLGTRSLRWADINAAAVHRNLLTIQLRTGQELTVGSRPAAWLAGHLGEHYDPVVLARTVATAAHRPDLRPRTALPDRLGRPQHLLNRISLAGYAVFTVVHHML
ncbi:hypothetical protein [Kitasatospora sp. NPDC097643]|uniref:hypothetical protein n=1 Tax=Kitasatospora sp. NPDC097643 TaxID=3157230 RepID=UPI00332E2537